MPEVHPSRTPGRERLVKRTCGRGPLPITQCPGGHDERPSSESSLLVAASGGRAGAKRSRPKRPALSKERRRAGEGLWTRGVGRAAWDSLAGPCALQSLWPSSPCVVSGRPMLSSRGIEGASKVDSIRLMPAPLWRPHQR